MKLKLSKDDDLDGSYLETKLVAVVGDGGLALGVLARHPPLEAAVESTPSVTFMVKIIAS